MIDLFKNSIDWNDVSGHEYDENDGFVCELGGGRLDRASGTLTLPVTLNFVIPKHDLNKIKRNLENGLGVSDVRFEFIFADSMKLSESDIIRLYIPYMAESLSGKEASFAKSIYSSSAVFDEETRTATVVCMSDTAADFLNRTASRSFSGILSETFGIKADVLFEGRESFRTEAADGSESSAYVSCIFDECEAMQTEKSIAKEEQKKPASEQPPKKAAASGKTARRDEGAYNGPRRRKVSRNEPAQGDHIMGKGIKGEKNTELADIDPSLGNVVIEGILFDMDARLLKTENYLASFLITDNRTTVCAKAFINADKWSELSELMKKGDAFRVAGQVQFDTYEHMNTVMVDAIDRIPGLKGREDSCEIGKRVELHVHTSLSAMDGITAPGDVVKQAAAWGQPAVAVTDHGVVQAFPDCYAAQQKLEEKGKHIKIIYGLEGYVYDDSDCVSEDGTIDYKKKGTNHIIILAKNQLGIKNIYKLVSFSHLNYFYRRPRLPKSLIETYREGLIIGSACEAGEVYRAVFEGKSDEETERIASFYDYLEIQPVINNRFMIERGMVEDVEELRSINKKIIALGDRLGKPVVATTDSHYRDPDMAIYRRIIMSGQGYKDAESGEGLFMRTTDEMLEEFSYLGPERAAEVVITNTNRIAEMVEDNLLPVPKEKYPPKIPGAEETLRNSCMEKAYATYGNPLPEEIEKRLETELNSVISNGYAVMYVSAQMLVKKSLSDGYLVGSRGSVGSSFAATMAGITEVNPLDPHYLCPKCKHLEWGDMQKYDCGIDMPPKNCPVCGEPMKRDGFTIPFATFLGFSGNKEPDIDLNFAGEYQATAHRYVGEIFGEKNVFKAGTVGTIAEKTAFGYVLHYAEEQNLALNKYDTARLAEGCTGIKRTTGQHPGGIVIVPDDHEIYEFCPVQRPANDTETDIVTTHFDYHKIDQNLLKLDILGHDIPSMIRQLQDMTGVDPLTVDLTDRNVLSIFNGTEALKIQDPEYRFVHGSYAIPEFGTPFTRQMLDTTKPDKFADLVRISGFSHGTDVWLNNAKDYIEQGVATMREVISTRDDIMNYLILKGVENETAFKIMEIVRKGKKDLNDEQVAVMKEHGVPDWYIDSCNKIKYMFPRAHAVAYTMMSFRMAWYKVYYPQEFYATYFTSKVTAFDAKTIIKGKEAILARMDEIRSPGYKATPKEDDEYTVLEVAYEQYARGYGFLPARLGKSYATKFWVSEGKVLLPFVAIEGVGRNAAVAFEQAYEEKPFETVEDAISRAKLNRTAVEGMREHGVFDGLPETDQLSLFSQLSM